MWTTINKKYEGLRLGLGTVCMKNNNLILQNHSDDRQAAAIRLSSSC